MRKELNQEIGRQMRRHRERTGMSVAELAAKAGISTVSVRNIESGKSCSLHTLDQIAGVMGLKVSVKISRHGKK